MVYPSQSVDYLVAGSGETAGSLPTVLRMCKQHREEEWAAMILHGRRNIRN
jgi:hypothetical protein